VKLSAIILARVLGFVETYDLAPHGKVFYPEFTRAVVERYKFQKFPKTFEDFDESKGIVFEEGKAGNNVIQKFSIFGTLLAVETRSGTDDSKQILEEMLLWGAAKFDLNYKPGTIKRFGYISDLTFYSDVPLLGAASQPFIDLSVKTTEAVSDIWQESVKYYPANLSVGHDPLSRKNGIAPFSITHRAEAKYSENKYFSEAPLPTDMHIQFLEEFEAGVKQLHDAARR
jgi:hypothetical protein